MRTGDVTPPPGYTATDFEIPTLRQVLNTFPNIPINIEIKMIKTTTRGTAGGCTTDNAIQYCDDPESSMVVADKLASLLNEDKYASRDDLIVVSFSDALIDEFHRMDGPPYVALAPGVTDTTNFALADIVPDPDVAAFQVPPDQLGTPGAGAPAQHQAGPLPRLRGSHLDQRGSGRDPGRLRALLQLGRRRRDDLAARGVLRVDGGEQHPPPRSAGPAELADPVPEPAEPASDDARHRRRRRSPPRSARRSRSGRRTPGQRKKHKKGKCKKGKKGKKK